MSNARPMPDDARYAAYRRANRTGRLTPRQLSRASRKMRHAAAPFGKKVKA